MSGKLFHHATCIAFLPGLVAIAAADTPVGGQLPITATWTITNSPYIAKQGVEVPVNGVLSIEPGVEVRFEHGGLMVAGTLIARGTSESPIRFTSTSETPDPGQWSGIRFRPSCRPAKLDQTGTYQQGTILENAVVEYSGGIVIESSNPLITRCQIRRNTNRMGGGILIWHASPVIAHNRIERNVAQHTGGGIRIVHGSPSIVENYVAFNQARSSGGGISADFSNPQIRRNTIVHNSAFEGGGISTGSPSLGESFLPGSAASSPEIVANKICHNFAIDSGGGIHVSGVPVIRDNLVACNVVGDSVSPRTREPEDSFSDAEVRRRLAGAGIYVQGTYGGRALMERNRVIANRGAAWGGGLCVVRGSALVQDNHFLRNQAGISGGGMSIVLVTPSATPGARPHGATMDIARNVIEENIGTGLELAGAGRQKLTIHSTTISANTPYNLVNRTPGPVTLTNCQLKSSEEGDGVFDVFDQPSLGKVSLTTSLAGYEIGQISHVPSSVRTWCFTSPQELVGGPSIKPPGELGSLVGLAWKPPAADFAVAGYRVYFDPEYAERSGGLGNGVVSPIDIGNRTTFRLGGIMPNTPLYLSVTAYNAVGDETAFATPIRVIGR